MQARKKYFDENCLDYLPKSFKDIGIEAKRTN